MRWLRLISALVAAKFRKKLSISEESNISFRVWLTDVDVSIMNHVSMMTVMEMGRLDFMVRLGFLRLATKKKWYAPLSSVSAQFLRPMKLFQKATLTTRVFHADNKWIYFEQKIVRKDKKIAVCLGKATVKEGRQTVPTKKIAQSLGIEELPKEGLELVGAYENENKLLCKKL